MKYIVLLGDGMADYPVPALKGKTPLEVANIPNFDWLARHGDVGLVHTIPNGFSAGSDVANLSVMGYDPNVYYSGRSPLEAVSMGIELLNGDVTYRCNLVTLSDDQLENSVMLDHSSGEITSDEAAELIKTLQEELPLELGHELHAGVSYRHCFVMRSGDTGARLTPPHDIIGKKVVQYLPKGVNGNVLLELMRASKAILDNHPINLKRQENGQNPANCCWFWGEGTRPALKNFYDLYQAKGGVISAVDLLKGIAICAGLKAPDVLGATGTLDTNYQAKLEAALDILSVDDFVYMHFEGPDECGHQGDELNKIKAIERIDSQVLAPLIKELDLRGDDYRILLLPDHATPIVERTHTSDAIPFVLYKKDVIPTYPSNGYTEKNAKDTGLIVEEGYRLMSLLLKI